MKANGYGLDGSRIKSRWGRDFPHPNRPALRPTQPPAQTVARPGLGVDNPLPSTAEVKEKIEVYVYSFSVPLWQIIK